MLWLRRLTQSLTDDATKCDAMNYLYNLYNSLTFSGVSIDVFVFKMKRRARRFSEDDESSKTTAGNRECQVHL